jgi:type 1 glutamine amidotransferase
MEGAGMKLKSILLAIAALALFRGEAQLIIQAPDSDLAKIKEIVSSWDAAKPKKARKALVFCRCEGFPHNHAISYALCALDAASRQTKAFTFDTTTDYRYMNAKNFAQYDAIVLLNCTNPDTVKNKNLEKDLLSFVSKGKGLCVIHAGCDGFYKAPAAAEMIGGQFANHPWVFGKTWSFKNEEPEHPLNRAFKNDGNPFARVEEVYQHPSPPFDRSKVRVLLSLNMKDKATANQFAKFKRGFKRTDNDFAVSWVRKYGNGRVFYTTFGHERNTFTDKGRLIHILDALQYTFGDLAIDDTPRK